MPGGSLAFPVGANHHIVAGVSAGGPTADVAVVEGVSVTKHHRVIAVLFHRWHGQHDRLGSQIHADERIGRVAVGRYDGCVFIGIYAGFVLDLIEGCLELPGCLCPRHTRT